MMTSGATQEKPLAAFDKNGSIFFVAAGVADLQDFFDRWLTADEIEANDLND